VNSKLVDESPLVSAFRNVETIAHLESLVSLDPEAPSWRFEVSCCSMGTWIEEQPGDGSRPRWSAQWPTAETSSAFDRLTPPDEIVDSLSDHLKRMQIAHANAVGGPLDGVAYYLEVQHTSTVLSLHY
jgi:hypothetical protein